jgi:GNAT superfamily N-acetyltransferase
VAEDIPLLLALFCSTKSVELAPLGFTPEQLAPLLQMQFNARQSSYASTFPHAVDMILCLADGTPVGRHLIDRQADCYRSVDLAVLPEHRNRGIGAWAVHIVQQLAQAEGLPLRLRALSADRAVHLYQRLGFSTIGTDEISFEMEWRPANLPARAAAPRRPAERIALPDGRSLDRIPVIDTILAFLRGIGLTIEMGAVTDGVQPGIRLIANGLCVDLDNLFFAGDLLHDAGHLAVMPPSRRSAYLPLPTTDGGEEMATLAWSYAAALHIGIPPEVVFHEHGYKGQGQMLIARYEFGDRPGVPLLAWMGLTSLPEDIPSGFPRMAHWLREQPPPWPANPLPSNNPKRCMHDRSPLPRPPQCITFGPCNHYDPSYCPLRFSLPQTCRRILATQSRRR